MAIVLNKTQTVATVGGSSGAYTHKLEVSAGNKDIENNKTSVSFIGYIKPNYNTWGWYAHVVPKAKISYKKTNSSTWITLSDVVVREVETNNTTYQQVVSRTIEIPHNDDGSLSIDVKYEFTPNTSDSYMSRASTIQNVATIPTIPRASTISVARTYIEETAMITINRASNDFTHTLTYSFMGETQTALTDTIANETSNTSVGFEVPSTFYDKIPNSATGICTITCQTYNGTTLIGTTTKDFTVECDPVVCKPDLTSSVIDINSTSVALTGDNTKLIKYRSTAEISATYLAKKSASISKLYVNGQQVLNFPVNVLNINTNNIVVRVEDSRYVAGNGFFNEVILNPIMIDYKALTLSASVSRNDATSGIATLTYNGNYFSGSFGASSNTLTLKYRYKENTTGANWSSWTTLTKSIDGVNGTYSGSLTTGAIFDYQKVYLIEIQAYDELTSLTAGGDGLMIKRGEPMWWYDEENFHILTGATLKGQPILEYDIVNDNSIKYKNGICLDSAGVVHNQSLLSAVINNMANTLSTTTNNLTDLFITATSSEMIVTGLTAGSKGFLPFTITVPPGYTAYLVGFTGNAQVASLGGLQLTCIFKQYVENTTTDSITETGYATYYAPTAITRANTKMNATYLLIKNIFIQ